MLALFARLSVQALSRSYRLRIVGREHLEAVLASRRSVVLACWHYQTLASVRFVLDRVNGPDSPVTALISQSRDGDLAAAIVERWGLSVRRGSTSRGGGAVLRALYRELRSPGAVVLLQVDGPRGPALEVKPGALVLAQMSQAPVLPIGLAARPALRVRSWDRMLVPLPGARVVVAVGEPLQPARQLDDPERERLRQVLTISLNRLAAAAEQELESRAG